MLKIIIFKKNQIEKNLKLLKSAYIKIDGYDDDDYLNSMILGSQTIGIAVIDNNVVGIGRIIGDGVRYSFIVDLVVDKKHQRKGIGTKLVQKLARSEKTKRVQLMNDPSHQWLKKFYKKVGFEVRKGMSVFEWKK